MPIWIPITLTAALFQTWRTALQQRLRGELSVNAVGFTRYVFAVPVGLAMLLTFRLASGQALPAPTLRFLAFCAAGGLLQILGTNLLIMAFGYRSFAVGTAYSKTEALQSAGIAWLLIGERLHALAWLGIIIAVGGVMVLSLAGRNLRAGEILAATVQPAALCGFGTGFCFSLTSIAVKEANRALGSGHIVLQALFVLVVTNTLQTLMQGGWLAWRAPAQLRAALAAWRRASWIGAMSATGSACWFTAFALAPVALVRCVGQSEMLLTLAFGRFYLGERTRRSDLVGMALIVAGVLVVVLTA